jgi:hypothetical protein
LLEQENHKMAEQEPIPGVLVSGIPGHETQPLSRSEYWALKTCLELYRSKNKELHAIGEAVRSCSDQHGIGKHYELGWFLRTLYGEIGEDHEEFDGLLTRSFEPPLLLQETRRGAGFDECDSLAAFLTVLRTDGWLAEWLDMLVRRFADPKPGAPPTPLDLMDLLTSEAGEFKTKIDNARRVLQHQWNALGFFGSTPPDPAAYRPPESANLQSIVHQEEDKLATGTGDPAGTRFVESRKDGPKREYTITMIEDSCHKEGAALTRREFQELKKHLSAMRARKSRKGKKAA